jgi:hypothetical protein
MTDARKRYTNCTKPVLMSSAGIFDRRKSEMETSRSIRNGFLVTIAIVIGSVANAAFVDDWQVAFGPPGYIGTFLGTQQGGGRTVFTDTSAAGVVGDFGATRTTTLTYSAPIGAGHNSFLSVNTFARELNLTQSVGQGVPVSVDISYAFAGGADLSNWTAFNFSVAVDQADASPFAMNWEITQGATTANESIDISGGGNFSLSFANFGGIDFANGLIDEVVISFATPAGFVGLDVGLSSVSVIPVPPAAGLILLGMIGMGLRTHFRRK